MIVSTTKMTARQYRQLGEDPPGVRLELVDGAIAVTPGLPVNHQHAGTVLTYALSNHVEARRLGVVFYALDVIVDPFTVRRPDVLYIADSNRSILTHDCVEGAPDLCVEVVSPSSGEIDRKDKFEQYAGAGVPHYWIVDPDARTFDAFSLRDGAYAATASARDGDSVAAPPFPDLSIPLGSLWL